MKKRILQIVIMLAMFGLSANAQFTQQGKLVGSGSVNSPVSPYEGTSVAISADGNTAIVGGNLDNNYTGAVWIFTRTAGIWSQQGTKLVGTGATANGAGQGISVGISGDGNTVVVGAPADSNLIGAAWVFIRTAGVWSQQGGKLIATGDVFGANKGTSVAISLDGNTVIMGGPRDNSFVGASWVFTRIAGVWTQQGTKLVGTGATGAARQGASVSLSSDGNTAIVGGYMDNSSVGAVWVFTRTGGVWTQQGNKLTGTGNSSTCVQGWSLALSPDGNTAIVGGNADNSNVGAAWIFTRTGGVWTQQGSKLVGSNFIGMSQQGTSVSVSHSGDTAVIGGYYDNTNIGATWVFKRTAGVWSQIGNKLIGAGAVGTAKQGTSVGISSDGSTVITGGPWDNTHIGAAWIFKSGSSGIEEEYIAKQQLVIYPNPANTILNIHQFTHSTNQLIITDILGNEIYKEFLTNMDNSISISTWNSGVYFYEVRGANTSERGKFIIQK